MNGNPVGWYCNELHVLERCARSEGHAHAVARLMLALVVNVNTAASARAHDHGVGQIVSMRPVASSIATRPRTAPSSTSSVVANHSS